MQQSAGARAYLDYAATAPLRPAARDAVIEVTADPVNPSSLHRSGRRASARLADAREQIASLVQAHPSEVLFTSGGTEADSLALTGLYRRARDADPQRRVVLVAASEHKAVLDTVAAAPEAQLRVIPVDSSGRLDESTFRATLASERRAIAMVAVMSANNETGVRTDLSAVSDLCSEFEVALHVDAVQTPATESFDSTVATTAALSGHKLGGPQGIGAVIVRREVELPVYTHGGLQEGGIRSGTVNVAGAVGMAAALAEAARDGYAERTRIAGLRDELQAGIVAAVPDVEINGNGRLASHLNVTFHGAAAHLVLMLLDGAGVEVSTGAACSLGIAKPSHVLLAMGRPADAAASSIRFSLGWASTAQDVARTLNALPDAVAKARAAQRVTSGARA